MPNLVRLGFHSKWIQWIMSCVTTVRYSVRFNNSQLESFKPSRGLRQGDPLSHYLFLFVADGLSHLMQKEVRTRNLMELHICRTAPGISHLLFTDDTLIFFQASKEQAGIIQKVIARFESGTDQLVNPTKCAMMFGNKCSPQNKAKVLEVLHVTEPVGEGRYLGLLTPEGRMHQGHFKTTKESLVKRCNNWAEKHMTIAAKEVLIKSVAQAIPTYVMGVFKLPAGMCDDMTQIIRKFWWGEEDGERKVHSIAWDKLLAPKCRGGMGLDMRLFNKALLARQAWHLVQYPNSLCAQLLKAKYYPRGELVDTMFPAKESPTWRSITYGLELLKEGIIWRIGSGEKVQIWRDPWIVRAPSRRLTLKR
jgi:hypothetical protein